MKDFEAVRVWVEQMLLHLELENWFEARECFKEAFLLASIAEAQEGKL